VSINHALLGLLSRGERCGYELRRELEDELGPDWRLDFGQLYRLLASMTRRRWIVARIEPGTRGPDRKTYRVTARGRAELRRWLRQPVAAVARERDELAVKLHFGAKRVAALLGARRRLLEAERTAHHARAQQAQRAHDVGRWLPAEVRLRQTEAALQALDAGAALIPRRAGARTSPNSNELVAVGSDDLVLELLARFLADAHSEIRFSTNPVGSLAGLIALREGRAHLAGIHLLDVDSGEYNVPFVKHLMPDEPVVLVNLAQRVQGLMLAPGNPKNLHGLGDLTRKGVRLINRQRGAGTRLLLHHRLRTARIDPRAISGYEHEAPTHNAVAAAIAAHTADVGPGIRAVAQAWGLDFIPLGHERYDLAIPRPIFDSARLRPLLEILHASSFRRQAAALSGYDVSHMCKVVADIH